MFLSFRHNDLPWVYRNRVDNQIYQVNLEEDVNMQWGHSHTDIPRLREGMVGAQVTDNKYMNNYTIDLHA